MVPTAQCFIAADCRFAHRAGMHGCPGCLGDGRRALLGAAISVTVTLDDHGNPIGIDSNG
jgi:hypothetical protein